VEFLCVWLVFLCSKSARIVSFGAFAPKMFALLHGNHLQRHEK